MRRERLKIWKSTLHMSNFSTLEQLAGIERDNMEVCDNNDSSIDIELSSESGTARQNNQSDWGALCLVLTVHIYTLLVARGTHTYTVKVVPLSSGSQYTHTVSDPLLVAHSTHIHRVKVVPLLVVHSTHIHRVKVVPLLVVHSTHIHRVKWFPF